MKNSDPDNDKFGALSRQVGSHKYHNEGVGIMCKAVEDYAKEYAKGREEKGKIEGKIEGKVETVKNMIKKNIPFETALECAQIDKATFEKYSESAR